MMVFSGLRYSMVREPVSLFGEPGSEECFRMVYEYFPGMEKHSPAYSFGRTVAITMFSYSDAPKTYPKFVDANPF